MDFSAWCFFKVHFIIMVKLFEQSITQHQYRQVGDHMWNLMINQLMQHNNIIG